MSNAMFLGITVLLYAGYLMLGAWYHFPVAWLDWQAPYFHYAQLASGAGLPQAFVLPAILFVWLAFIWYRKSMIHEA